MAKGKSNRANRGPLAPKNSLKVTKGSQSSDPRKAQMKKAHKQPSQTTPYIPFTASSHIFLVGEGDFSFSHSLLTHHPDKFTHLLATTFESPETLSQKHPQTAAYLAELDDDPSCEVAYTIDATKLRSCKFIANHTCEGDAKGWDWIVFNFPHVGGLSTDVRRQVRANQELLVKFFEGCKSVLRQPKLKLEAWEDTSTPEETEMRKTGGKVLVTLFEGEPYTLWNVKDLARHAGLVVERSFTFRSEGYSGYQHARTLGNVRGKGKVEGPQSEDDEVPRSAGGEGEVGEKDHEGYEKHVRPGAWRGEERPARSYIFKLPMPEKTKERGHLRAGGKAAAEAESDSDDE